MFGRKKRQQRYIQDAERVVFEQVLQAASETTFPGDEIKPENVHRAAQMVGMQVIQGAMQGGASPADCRVLMAMYTDVGERVGQMFAPGGPMHGATAPGPEER